MSEENWQEYALVLQRKTKELEAENHRLRDLLDCKVGSSIRVELPVKENGWKCYITTQREKDEEHLAEIFGSIVKLMCDHMSKKEDI